MLAAQATALWAVLIPARAAGECPWIPALASRGVNGAIQAMTTNDDRADGTALYAGHHNHVWDGQGPDRRRAASLKFPVTRAGVVTILALLVLTSLVGFTVSGTPVPALVTNLLTVYGQAWLQAPRVTAPAGYSVGAHNISRSTTVSVVMVGSNQGRHTLTFVDFATNRAAVGGDALELTLIDPQGRVVGEAAKMFIEKGSIDSHLLDVDVNPGVVPAKPSTWGFLKALFQ